MCFENLKRFILILEIFIYFKIIKDLILGLFIYLKNNNNKWGIFYPF